MKYEMKSNPAAERAKFVSAVILYGTIGAFLRQVHLPSEVVALARGALGSLFILAFLRLRFRRGPDWAAIRQNGRWLLLSGVLLGLNWIFLFAAYMETTVAVASLLNYMAPLAVILAAPLALGERLEKRKLPFVFLALAGIFLVCDLSDPRGANPKGILLGALAALCFTGIVLCNRKLRRIAAYDRAAVQLALSALTILPYTLVKNGGLPLPRDGVSAAILLMLGLVHTGVAYCFYFSGMGSLPVQSVALLGYLEPVVSVLTSALVLGEPLTPRALLGAALILTSAALSELPTPMRGRREEKNEGEKIRLNRDKSR